MYNTHVLLKHPVLLAHSLLPGVPGRWLWTDFSTHCDCWFTVIVGCTCWKSSAGRTAVSQLWAAAGSTSFIFYPSCSTQNILSVHSMSWRQLIHSGLWKTASFIHMLFQDCYFFKQQIFPCLSIKEGKLVSLLLVSTFSLVQNQLTALFRSRLNIWNKHWILLFLFASFLNQTRSQSVVFWSLCSSHFWLYVHMAIYFINLLPLRT